MARQLSNPVYLASPEKGVDGRTTLAGARAPLITDGRIGDFWIDTRTDEQRLYGPKNAAGWPDLGLIKGNRGWTPVFGVVSDGSRRVQRVVDWQGGEGPKPTTGLYVSATGLVTDVADAIDIRGPEGPEMDIDGLAAATTDIDDATQLPVAEAGDDNEKRTVIEIFDLGSVLDRQSVAHAAATNVRRNVKRIRTQFFAPDFADASSLVGGANYIRVNSEPTHLGKFRSLDRWTAEGDSDSLNGGWWEIAEATVTPEMFGIQTGVNQQTIIKAMMEWAAEHGITIQWGPGPYVWSAIYVRQNDMDVRWRFHPKGTIFRSDKVTPDALWGDDHFLQLNTNTIRQETLASSGLFQGGSRVTLASTADIVPDDTLLMFFSSRVIETDHRNQARHGFVVPVSAIIDGTTVEISKTIPYTMAIGNTNSVAITAVDLVNNHFTCSSLIGQARSDMRYRIRFNTVGGAASTVTLLPSDFDPATGRYTFGTANATLPAGLQAGDTINIERQVDVFISRSVKLDMEGKLTIERPNMHIGAVAGDNGFRGFRVYRGLRPKIHDIVTRNFSEAGLVLDQCYAANLQHQEHWNCNRAYNGFDGTGYGVAISNTGWCKIDDIKGFGCRRTLDVGGSQQVSWNNEISNVEGYGGGTAYTGDRFWPVGTVECSVVGSHGGAFGTRYTNSRGLDVTGVINCRGADEVVRGVYGAGKMEQLVNSFYGDGLDADGLYYTDGHPEWVSDFDYAYATPQADRKLMDVIRIAAFNIIPTKPHHFANIVARGVWRSLLSIETGSGSPGVGPITVGGIVDIQTDNQNGLDTSFNLVRRSGTGGAVTVNGPLWLGAVNIKNHPAAPKDVFNLINLGQFTWSNGAFFRAPNGMIGVTIADDTVFKLPVYRIGTCNVDILPQNRDRTWRMRGGQVELEQAGDASTGPRSNLVDVSASVLIDGTTTGTDGNVTLAFCPVGGTNHLYVKNRTGASDNFWIACTAAAV